jgi:hypothetical protein
MSGWAVLAGCLLVLAAVVVLLVLRRVAHAATATATALRSPPSMTSEVGSSKVLARLEHLADGRPRPTADPSPPR